ncbi:MAG TPA: O-antigen ligase family protein [Clostridiales bacterium]|nr:O-antigen ligase family protein [Clostridiales bacterium]
MMNFVAEKAKPFAETKEEAILFLLTISLFMPFYFSVASVCLVAVMTMMNYQMRVKAFSAPYTGYLLGILIVPFFVAAVYSNYWGMLYEMVLIAVVITGFYVKSVMTPELFHKVLDLACTASIWCAGIAIYQKVSAYAAAPAYRPVSVFHNANTYGMMIEFIVIIALYRAFTNKRKMGFYFGVIALNLVGLYLAASVSALLATGCAVLTFLFLKKQYKIMAGFLAVTVLLSIACLLVPSLFPRGIIALDTTCTQRLSIWSTALKGIMRHPFMGTGAMSYQMIYEQYGGYQTYHCHNLLLDTLLNYGFVGLGAFGIYVIAQLKLLSLRFHNHTCTDMNILVIAMLAAVAVHGMTDVTIYWIQTGMLFMLLFASTGIGAESFENEIRIPAILPEYSDQLATLSAYLKN